MAEFIHFGEPLLSYVGMHYIILYYIILYYIILYYILYYIILYYMILYYIILYYISSQLLSQNKGWQANQQADAKLLATACHGAHACHFCCPFPMAKCPSNIAQIRYLVTLLKKVALCIINSSATYFQRVNLCSHLALLLFLFPADALYSIISQRQTWWRLPCKGIHIICRHTVHFSF